MEFVCECVRDLLVECVSVFSLILSVSFSVFQLCFISVCQTGFTQGFTQFFKVFTQFSCTCSLAIQMDGVSCALCVVVWVGTWWLWWLCCVVVTMAVMMVRAVVMAHAMDRRFRHVADHPSSNHPASYFTGPQLSSTSLEFRRSHNTHFYRVGGRGSGGDVKLKTRTRAHEPSFTAQRCAVLRRMTVRDVVMPRARNTGRPNTF